MGLMRLMRPVVAVLLSLAVWSVAACASAQAQEEKYLRQAPVRRLALIVGNADYKIATKLPGNITDAERMRDVLKDAQFDVTYAPNVATRQQFVELYLRPFVGKIAPHDFVVFYFSGHGFSYSDENYLVPLEFPAEVFDTEIADNFLSAQAIHNIVLERKPGVLLSLLDACRNAADFIKIRRRDDNQPVDPDLKPKTLAEFRSPTGNIIIGFASKAGASADGSSVAGKLSIYTRALVKYLPTPDTEFGEIRKDVRLEVLHSTNSKQTPWVSDSNSVNIFFKPTELTHGQELLLWKGLLNGGNYDDIEHFADRHSISRYAAAARQWLADHPKPTVTTDFTRISPSALEIGWIKAGGVAGGKNGQTVKLRSVNGPFAFPRVAKPGDKLPGALHTTDLVLAEDNFPTTSTGRFTTDLASTFVENGKAVISSRIGANAAPSNDAKLVADIKPGAKIDVLGYSTDANNKAWVKAMLPTRSDPVYIPIPTEAKTQIIDIGKPLLEVAVPGAKSGLRSAIDDKVVLDALAKLRADKSSIERVAIASPRTADANMASLYAERVRYLIQMLNEAGIGSARISTSNASDIDGDNLRLRVFGN
jgi:hypothetical protein